MGSKHYRKLIIVTTKCEKSAEVIVLEKIYFRKDRTTARFEMKDGKVTRGPLNSTESWLLLQG